MRNTFDRGVTERKTTVTARRGEVPPTVGSLSVFCLLDIGARIRMTFLELMGCLHEETRTGASFTPG